MAFVNSFDTFDGWVVPPVEWIQTANFKPLCDLSSEFTILLIELIHLLANLSELASKTLDIQHLFQKLIHTNLRIWKSLTEGWLMNFFCSSIWNLFLSQPNLSEKIGRS